MSFIDVRFHFDEVVEDGRVIYHDLVNVERFDYDIPDDDMLAIGETLAQSDRWNVGGVNATLAAMVDGGVHDPKDYL